MINGSMSISGDNIGASSITSSANLDSVVATLCAREPISGAGLEAITTQDIQRVRLPLEKRVRVW
jgi:hypothetical protein